MDAEDVAQITESLRLALAADPSSAKQSLTEFGWRELLDDEPAVAVPTLFTLAGQLLIHGSELDAVMLRAGGLAADDDARLVLPPPGGHAPASRLADDATVRIDGVVHNGSGPVIVPLANDERGVSFVKCAAPETLPGVPLDESANWARVTTTAAVVGTLEAHDGTQVWEAMVAAGRRALAHELNGVAGEMMSMTVEHVRDRVQFGQPLGRFQSVKHQLADVHLWREVAALTAEAAWEDCTAPSAALAKTSALRFSRSARTVCQQLLGGMGFTWEHAFHRYLRRALTVEPLLGSTAALHTELGAALRAGQLSDALAAL